MRDVQKSLLSVAVVTLWWMTAPGWAQQRTDPEPVVGANQPTDAALLSESGRVLRDQSDEPIGSDGQAGARSFVGGDLGKPGPWSGGLMPLAVVLLVIAALAYAVKRFFAKSAPGGDSSIQVLNKTYLSSKQSLALVRVGRRMMMLGITPDHISHLTTIDDPGDVDALSAGVEPGRARLDRFSTALGQETVLYRPDALEPHIDEPELRTVRHARQGMQDLLRRLKAMNQSAQVS